MTHKLKSVSLEVLKEEESGKVISIGIIGDDYRGMTHRFLALSLEEAKDIAHLMLRALYLIETGKEVPDELSLD